MIKIIFGILSRVFRVLMGYNWDNIFYSLELLSLKTKNTYDDKTIKSLKFAYNIFKNNVPKQSFQPELKKDISDSITTSSLGITKDVTSSYDPYHNNLTIKSGDFEINHDFNTGKAELKGKIKGLVFKVDSGLNFSVNKVLKL